MVPLFLLEEHILAPGSRIPFLTPPIKFFVSLVEPTPSSYELSHKKWTEVVMRFSPFLFVGERGKSSTIAPEE